MFFDEINQTSLVGVQAQVVRRLTGRIPQRKPDGKWTYTSAATTREDAGFLSIEDYIRRRHNTVARYIYTRPLLDMCGGLERAMGAQVGMQWWEHVGRNMAGAREAAAASAERYGG